MRNVSAISRIFPGNPAAAMISREKIRPARREDAATRHPKRRDCLATSSASREVPSADGPGDQGYRPGADGVGDDDDEKVEKADETDRRLDLGADETRHVDIGKTHEEIEDHDEQHRPRELPDVAPDVSGGQAGRDVPAVAPPLNSFHPETPDVILSIAGWKLFNINIGMPSESCQDGFGELVISVG